MLTEANTVERKIVEELKKLGWEHVDGRKEKDKIEQLRGVDDLSEPLLVSVLRESIRRLNSEADLSDEEVDRIVEIVRSIPATIDGMSKWLDILRNGITLTWRGKDESVRSVKIVDFENLENNNFTVINQFEVGSQYGKRITDIVLFVNGLPPVVIEYKSPVREEVSWYDGYLQLKRYEREIPQLMKYVLFAIATDGGTKLDSSEPSTVYYPVSFLDEKEEYEFVRRNRWKDPYPHKVSEVGKDDLMTTIYGLLDKKNLLDIAENFVFIKKDPYKGQRKIMARYMQFRAANKIVDRVVKTIKGEEDKHYGLIWHWQGSGNTLTIAFAAWKLYRHRSLENPTIFIMVDRKDLEVQMMRELSGVFGGALRVERISSIRRLIETLTWGGEGKRGLFLVTIEKFSPKEFEEAKKELGSIKIDRKNVIVLADEVHRTHYGKFATIMRSVFPNGFIFGFTGTPVSKIDRNTFQKFSPPGELYLDRYSMLDYINDGYTVEISYQARLPQHHLSEEKLEELAKVEEEMIDLTEEEKRRVKRRIRPIVNFLKNSERIQAIAKDLAEHFKAVVEPTGMKAMLVTVDREACVLYKKELDKHLPPEYTEVVMTFQGNDKGVIREYYEELCKKYGTTDVKQIHDKIIYNFKKTENPKILIVTDMLITGFDAPILWTLYIDKPLKEHRLLQTIARTNRPYKNKMFGLIVDYVGILGYLEKALAQFEKEDRAELVIRDLDKYFEDFKKLLDELKGLFADIDKDDLDAILAKLEEPNKQKEFERKVKRLMKLYEMLAGEEMLADYLGDYSWITRIYVAMKKKYLRESVDELKIREISEKTNRIIRESIKFVGKDKKYPEIRLTADKIQQILKNPPKERGALIDLAASLWSNINREARIRPTKTVLQLREKVQRAYEELLLRQKRTEEVVQKLLSLAKEYAKIQTEQEALGEVYYVYEALKESLPSLDTDIIKDLATKIVRNERVRKYTEIHG